MDFEGERKLLENDWSVGTDGTQPSRNILEVAQSKDLFVSLQIRRFLEHLPLASAEVERVKRKRHRMMVADIGQSLVRNL